jgi:endonuclease/exonuclease/phosphatase family metal-dependent hydrolase
MSVTLRKALFIATTLAYSLFAQGGVVVGTWNGNWFPSGRAEHRAHPSVELATTEVAANMLSSALAAIDPQGTNDVILILNEIRSPSVASNLIKRISRKGLTLASISGYRRRDRYDQQQDVIVTTLEVASRGWSRWRNEKAQTPPRGYAYANIVITPAVTARVYAVHFKSNYGGNTEEKRALNRAKREHSARQIVEQVKKLEHVIVAGDLNTDPWRKEFARESTHEIFKDAHFVNHLEELPPGRRATHPNKRHGDSSLDFVLSKGFRSLRLPHIEPGSQISDHLALFTLLEADEPKEKRKQKRKERKK